MREVHQWSCKCFDTSKAHFRTPFLRMFFRQFSDRCPILLISIWISMCCEVPFRLAASLYMVTMCFANLAQPAWKLSSFDKDALEHTELRVHQYEQGIQRLSNPHNPPLTGQPMFSMVFIGFHGFSEWWHCSSSWSALVPHGSSWFLKTFLVQRS